MKFNRYLEAINKVQSRLSKINPANSGDTFIRGFTNAIMAAAVTCFEPNDDLSNTLLIQMKSSGSSAECRYLADLRMTRQLELTKTLNQRYHPALCRCDGRSCFCAIIRKARNAPKMVSAALQSETILSTTLDAVVVADERGLIRK